MQARGDQGEAPFGGVVEGEVEIRRDNVGADYINGKIGTSFGADARRENSCLEVDRATPLNESVGPIRELTGTLVSALSAEGSSGRKSDRNAFDLKCFPRVGTSSFVNPNTPSIFAVDKLFGPKITSQVLLRFG